MDRNLSVNQYFYELALRHNPKYRFGGSDWQSWHSQLLPKVKASLGKMPESVPLNPQVLAKWTEDGIIKERVVFDVEQGLSAVADILLPEEKHSNFLINI